jgi:serine/threonine protein kinase
VTFPDPDKHKIYVSPKAQDLINKLLAKKKENRLGAKNGIEEILLHPFFADLDIELLKKKQLKPKYMPDI